MHVDRVRRKTRTPLISPLLRVRRDACLRFCTLLSRQTGASRIAVFVRRTAFVLVGLSDNENDGRPRRDGRFGARGTEIIVGITPATSGRRGGVMLLDAPEECIGEIAEAIPGRVS